ncbi:MAG: hypothetical protein K2H09_07775, partial [Treponemataceae bacterium]|nr:hypothetical protein [Treponemataceae bacterium]
TVSPASSVSGGGSRPAPEAGWFSADGLRAGSAGDAVPTAPDAPVSARSSANAGCSRKSGEWNPQQLSAAALSMV